jgi:sugar lactone lactonase YvrE
VTPIRGTDVPLLPQAKWSTNGTTVAGGNGKGEQFDQLNQPGGLYVDDNQTVYVADFNNHRVVAWSSETTLSQVVAGGKGQGGALHQLYRPTDVIMDRSTYSLLICELGNKRVVSWPHRGGIHGDLVLSDIQCFGLTMDDRGFLYVSVVDKDEVRRFKLGESQGTLVAGGNHKGDRLDQLNLPIFLFVDRDHSLYVSDYNNHRVVKWVEGAKQGELVAGGHGPVGNLTQLLNPYGVVVDGMGTVYVADEGNHRIMRWSRGATEGNLIVGGMGMGDKPNQLNTPAGLSFDRHGRLYVVDGGNSRLQRFHYSRMHSLFTLERFSSTMEFLTFRFKIISNIVIITSPTASKQRWARFRFFSNLNRTETEMCKTELKPRGI